MNDVNLSREELNSHVANFGTTGQGISIFLMEEAKKRGIHYEQLLRECEPSPEMAMEEHAQNQKHMVEQSIRLQAVRLAYWESTPKDSTEFLILEDIVTSLIEGIEETTIEQDKILFMMLPGNIIGEAVKFGLDDTVVRDDICEFVRDNKEYIKNAFNNAG